MPLSAEAARLAALEVLCPTAALAGDAPYPTLAGYRVFDSRAVAIDDLDRDAKYTPCLSLYTPESSATARSPVGDVSDSEARGVLEIVAELAVASKDDGGDFADAMLASDDWDARLALAALCGQVRRLLVFGTSGNLFRRFIRGVDRVTEETFAVPQIGARWHRITMRLELSLRDDEFADAAGLPEPLKTLAGLLPAGSPAAKKLAALGAHFTAVQRHPLEGITFDGGDQRTGLTADTR